MSKFSLSTVFACLVVAFGLTWPFAAAAQTKTIAISTSPVIVATKAQMTKGLLANTQLDSSVSTYAAGGNRFWLGTSWFRGPGGGLRHTLTKGGLDNPYGAVAWIKNTCNRSSNNYCINGINTAFTSIIPQDVVDLWFVNLYQPQPLNGSLLGFIHEEKVGNTSVLGHGKTRIGLAWSADNGNTWKYLGRIISPYHDEAANAPDDGFNVMGLPYVVKDGYFYVYFRDRVGDSPTTWTLGTARARVADVLQAANMGRAAPELWKKYYHGYFSEPGIEGKAERNTIGDIPHTQAIHSSIAGKYYLVTSRMTWGGTNSIVRIYQSTDAVNWTPFHTIANEAYSSLAPDSGYQYCSSVDRNGAPNAETQQVFYVYCMKNPIVNDPDPSFAIYRWEVNLGPSVDMFRQSADFSSQQGPYWNYLESSAGVVSSMHWNQGYWSGADSWARIQFETMHPGSSQPLLEWVAPRTGVVRIEGTVRDFDLACGDGVNAIASHNGSTFFSASIANGDTVGRSLSVERSVVAGDGLYFSVAANGNNYCDTTRWDPSIRYVP